MFRGAGGGLECFLTGLIIAYFKESRNSRYRQTYRQTNLVPAGLANSLGRLCEAVTG
jgi:hypothetical protein